jgi:hypothetical protein
MTEKDSRLAYSQKSLAYARKNFTHFQKNLRIFKKSEQPSSDHNKPR